MGLYFWPYKAGSRGCRAIAEELGARRLRSRNSKFVARARHTVINWGNGGDMPSDFNNLGRLINHPNAVALATNKRTFFRTLRDNSADDLLPPWADNRQDALVLLSNMDKPKLYCRTKLQGHSGEGIVIATNESELVNATLYTSNLGWRREYRVHVAFGNVIDTQKKCRLSPENLEERGIALDMDVRNLNGGWIYARERIEETEEVLQQMRIVSCITVRTLGLDFGAVDICVLKDGSVRVLEVNTACGLEGSTVQSYANAIREELNEVK